MRLIVNGVMHELEASTLAQALDLLGYADLTVATAVNSRFVAAGNRITRTLVDGDSIDIVAPMQGG